MHLNMSPAEWRPFCTGGDELILSEVALMCGGTSLYQLIPASLRPLQEHTLYKIDGLLEDGSNPSVLAMEILQFCTEPSKYHLKHEHVHTINIHLKFEHSPYKWERKRIPWTPFSIKQCIAEGFDSCERSNNLAQIRSKSLIFSVRVTLKFYGWPLEMNREPLPCLSSYCFHFITIHEFRLIGVIIRKLSNWTQVVDFLAPVTLQFGRWHRIQWVIASMLLEAMCVIS